MKKLQTILREVRRCEICAEHLPLGPRPVVTAHENARILIVGQAPGTRVHETGIPWNDPSGNRLREWLNVSKDQFYDPELLALVPMGFCYPGRGRSGDLPPRPACAATWHDEIMSRMPRIAFTVLLGQYAHAYYLGDRRKSTLTETVRAWKEYRPRYVAVPHPSPRNNNWLKANRWFKKEVLPYLRRRLKMALR